MSSDETTVVLRRNTRAERRAMELVAMTDDLEDTEYEPTDETEEEEGGDDH